MADVPGYQQHLGPLWTGTEGVTRGDSTDWFPAIYLNAEPIWCGDVAFGHPEDATREANTRLIAGLLAAIELGDDMDLMDLDGLLTDASGR